jgi:hypothetical protein
MFLRLSRIAGRLDRYAARLFSSALTQKYLSLADERRLTGIDSNDSTTNSIVQTHIATNV